MSLVVFVGCVTGCVCWLCSLLVFVGCVTDCVHWLCAAVLLVQEEGSDLERGAAVPHRHRLHGAGDCGDAQTQSPHVSQL